MNKTTEEKIPIWLSFLRYELGVLTYVSPRRDAPHRHPLGPRVDGARLSKALRRSRRGPPAAGDPAGLVRLPSGRRRRLARPGCGRLFAPGAQEILAAARRGGGIQPRRAGG